MLERYTPSRRSWRTFAVGGAWFFIVVSLLHLAWAFSTGGPGSTAKLYHTVAGGVSYDAWGLTYSGSLGLLLVAVQAAVVIAAAVASKLTSPRTVKLRRAGHLVLCGWSALWTLNLLRLAAIDHQVDTIAQAALLGLLFGCTVYRATAGWSPPGRVVLRGGGPDEGGPVFVPRFIPEPPPPSLSGDGPDEKRRALATQVKALAGRAGPAMRSGRRKAAGALHRVADFTRRQAERVAPSTGE